MKSKRQRRLRGSSSAPRAGCSTTRRLALEQLEARLVLALTVDLGVGSLVEGQAATAATVTRTGGDISAALVVSLASSDATEASVPATVTIPANQLSAPFTVSAIADKLVDDAVVVTITASAAGHADAHDALSVVNADALPLRPGVDDDAITLTPGTPNGRFTVAGASPAEWTPPIVDLSVLTPADQRTALALFSGSRYSNAKSLVKINPAERYTIYAETLSEATSPDNRPLAYLSLDVDQKVIESIHVARYAFATDTMLAAALKPNDTSLLIDNASGWSNDAWESADTRALAWYGYADSTGHVYADYTYTRNVAQAAGGLWAAGGIHYDPVVGAYRIDLLAPWSGPEIAAGAAIRNAEVGDRYNLPAVEETLSSPVAAYTATIGGAVWLAGERNEFAFRPGTAFVQPAVASAAPWTGLAIAPEQDAIDYGPLDFAKPVVDANGLHEMVLDLDVLNKNVFGASATVVIESATAQHGAASIAPGPAGRNVVRYRSTSGFAGTDVVQYTLRNTATNSLHSGEISLTVVDTADAQRLEKLGDIATAMQNYESSLKRFPVVGTAAHFDDSGNPYLSWRVHLLPYLGYQSLYNQFHLNEPWNSAHNLPLAAQMPNEFRDPLADPSSMVTRFRIVSGEGSIYYWQRSGGLLVGPANAQLGQDGLPHTLLVVETGADAAVTWTQPDLPNFNPAAPLAALGTITSDRINAVTADGRQISLPSTIDPAVFTSLVTINGNEIVDANTLRREFAQSQGPAAVEAFAASVADYYFKVVGLGMHGHESAQQRFPVAGNTNRFDASGNPKLSWRVHILPYMGYQNLYERFHLDETWDSPNNLPLLAEMPDVFRSAQDGSGSTSTRVVTFTGPEAPFGFRAAGSTQLGPRAIDVQDGFTNTIMFVEAGANVAVPWTKPEDVPLDVANPYSALGNLPNGALRATMFDVAVLTFPAEVMPVTLKALATRNGGESVSAASVAAGATINATQNLRNLALAMLNHESQRGRFPVNQFTADGTPLLSWRVELLPFIGFTSLYNQFHRDEPWDSPHNLALLKFMPSVFRSADSTGAPTTRMATFTGVGAPFPAEGTDDTVGPRLEDITDGTGNTLMLVEAGSDRAVPWTKPVDVPYHPNNPYSALGEVGEEFLAAFFHGAVIPQPTSNPISTLSARITHQGGGSSDAPSATAHIYQTHGDTRLGEFGVDWFDVLLDAPPATPTMLMLNISDPGVAMLDKQSLTFTAANWNVPQRVSLRAIDNFNADEDRTILVTTGSQSFAATVVNDDSPPPADFDENGAVDGHDFLAWQRGFGLTGVAGHGDGDADADLDVDDADLGIWKTEFAPPPSADFDGSGVVDGADFLRWQRGFGVVDNALFAQGDANTDGSVDGEDLTAWAAVFGLPQEAMLMNFNVLAGEAQLVQLPPDARLPAAQSTQANWIDADLAADRLDAAQRGQVRATSLSPQAAADATFSEIGESLGAESPGIWHLDFDE